MDEELEQQLQELGFNNNDNINNKDPQTNYVRNQVYPEDYEEERNEIKTQNRNSLIQIKNIQNDQQAESVKQDEPDAEPLNQKKNQNFTDQIKNGISKVINVPKNGLQYLLNGGQKQNKQIYNQTLKRSAYTQNLMKDNDFKNNHKIQYYLLLISFYFQYVFMPGKFYHSLNYFKVFILFGTIMCIITLILWNYYFVGQLDPSSYNALVALDIITGIAFIMELLYKLSGNPENFLLQLLDIENLVDFLLVFHIFWRVAGNTNYKGLAFFNVYLFVYYYYQILRALRVTKLRYITKLVQHYLKNLLFETKNDDLSAEKQQDFDEEGELQTFIIDSLIKFSSSILIESTYFLVFDELMDYEGFYPHSKELKMDYLKAAYFTIVSFSTIGYGDIYPRQPLTRICSVLALIVNITVMSNFLGKMVEFLFQLSPYDTTYEFNDHIVIIGKIPDDQLKQLLDEIVELDLAQRNLIHKSSRIKVLIVKDDEPSEFMVDLAFFYTEEYENEVNFLKEGIFTQHQKWRQILYAFSWENDDGSSFENDQKLALLTTGVKNSQPDLRIVIIFNSSFKSIFDKDTLYRGIESISPYQLNDYIMASTLQNPGLGTILYCFKYIKLLEIKILSIFHQLLSIHLVYLQHLITMQAKIVPDYLSEILHFDPFLKSYVSCMQQEIYQFAIPDFFVGMTFSDLAQLLYLYGLYFGEEEVEQNKFFQDHIKDDRKMTLIGIETSKRTLKYDTSDKHFISPPNTTTYQKQDEELNGFLFDSNTKRQVQQILQKKEKTIYDTHILINPENYQLKKGDIGYVICEEYEIVKEVLSINSQDSPQYQNFQSNLSKLNQNKSQNNNNFEDCLIEMYQNLQEQNENMPEIDQWVGIDINFSEVFDLTQENCPLFKFKQHIIIFGNLESFMNIIQITRQYTHRPLILYSQNNLNLNSWNDLRQKTSNIFYVKGEYLNLDHLKFLEIRKASKILITSDLENSTFSDAVGLCLARIVLDHFDRSDFVIELKDETKLSFLNNNPKFKHKIVPSFMQPFFGSGNVQFTSMITGILAKVAYTPNWIHFFQDIINPQPSDISIRENKQINYLIITEKVAQDYHFFGQMQLELMQSTPSVIAIGLVKKTFGSKFKESVIDNFLQQEFYDEVEKLIQDIEIEGNQDDSPVINVRNRRNSPSKQKSQKNNKQIKYQVQGILAKMLGDKIVLTNPSFYSLIEEGDGIIVLGDKYDKDANINDILTSDTDEQKAQRYIQKLIHSKRYDDFEAKMEMKGKLIKMSRKKLEMSKEFYETYEIELESRYE